MSKKRRNRFVSKEERLIDLIRKNRHYCNEVKNGLIKLNETNYDLQNNVRRAYQKVTDWLRVNNCNEFTVEQIFITTWDKDHDRHDWLNELSNFVCEPNQDKFTEYGTESVFVTFVILTSEKFEYRMNVAELFSDQYKGDPHCIMSVNGNFEVA